MGDNSGIDTKKITY